MNRFYIGLGSNSGDRDEYMTRALQGFSSLYETPPWGVTNQRPFLNAVVAIDTDLKGEALLQRCRTIEAELGRVRHCKWGARTIDLDLLFSEREECHTEFLEMPHPYLTQRAFVLVPLMQVAGNCEIQGKPLGDWLSRLTNVNEIKEVKRPVRGYLQWKEF